jgi:phage gpG-like protein
MTGYTIEIIGLEKMLAGMASLESSFSRLSPLMERFGGEFRGSEVALFRSAPWTPLKPASEAAKARKFGGPSQIMVASGDLFRSLTEKEDKGHIHRVSDDGAEFGSNVFYGIFHHEGRGRLPERKLLAEPDEQRYETIAGEYAAEMLKEAGFQ